MGGKKVMIDVSKLLGARFRVASKSMPMVNRVRWFTFAVSLNGDTPFKFPMQAE